MNSIKELMGLSGRTAVITGGAGYLGQAINESLIELGAKTILLDISQNKLDEVISKSPDHSVGIEVDLENESAVREVLETLSSNEDSIHIFVHSAALVGTSDVSGWAVPFEEQKMDSWRRAMEVNLNSFFLISQLLSEKLKSSGKGSVIAIGSIYGVSGPDMSFYEGTSLGNPAAYAASKGGLLQLVKWLSTVLAPEVRVNAISPGGILRGQDEIFQKKYISKTPMERMATEEDLKGAVAYFASDLSAYVTGQNLMVDGGWTVW